MDAGKQCEDDGVLNIKIWQVVLAGLGHREGYFTWSWEEGESKEASLSYSGEVGSRDRPME